MGDKPVMVACIPAFNEERMIARVVLLAKRYVDKVVVCDDGSGDLTGEVAGALGAVVIRHEGNRGKGVALRSAFLRAKELKPDVVVVLDADGQHDPNEIPKLLEPVMSGEADMVVGSRYVEGSKSDAPLYRRVGLRLVNALRANVSSSAVGDSQSGFRAFSSRALEVVLGVEAEGYGVETEQLALAKKGGLRVVEVPVAMRYSGLVGTSKRNPAFHGFELVDTVLMLVVVERPLLFLALPGAVLSLIGVGVGVYSLWYFNLTRYFSIPMTLVAVGAVFVGMLMVVSSMMLYAMKRIGRRASNE